MKEPSHGPVVGDTWKTLVEGQGDLNFLSWRNLTEGWKSGNAWSWKNLTEGQDIENISLAGNQAISSLFHHIFAVQGNGLTLQMDYYYIF